MAVSSFWRGAGVIRIYLALAAFLAATMAASAAPSTTHSISSLSTARGRPEPLPCPAGVLNGIDVLADSDFAALQGLRVGLVTNHTGKDRQRNPTIDLLYCAPDVDLRALFSPEHGIRGALDEKVGDGIDEATCLPIYSLYGERLRPAPEQLACLDALVFDIQDIGCRFYTYISTMGHCLEAAARASLKIFVLDRVNPITGARVDGPVLTDPPSFTGFHTIPVQHGMTVGELARMFNTELQIHADLTVIPVRGWKRDAWFDATDLPWTNPSPNMRSLTQATLYPGVGLLETTHLSVGRGTDTPFEVIGAPYIDDLWFATALNREGIPGVRFVPIRFTPKASVFKDRECGGVSMILTDREKCPVIDIGLTVARILHQRYPDEFGLDRFNRLLGHQATIQAIRDGLTNQQIRKIWREDLAHFLQRRERYLLYR